MKLKQYILLIFAIALASPVQAALAAPAELSLENCIVMALKNNNTVKTAAEDQEKYSWAVKEAIGNNGLSLTLTNNDYRKEKQSDSGSGPSSAPYNLVTNQINMSLPLYNGGKSKNLIDEAKLNYKTAELNLAAAKQQTRFNVTASYYQVLQYRNLAAADQASVDDYALHLKNLETSYTAGMASKLQVLQTKVSLANAEQTRIKDENSYRVALINLGNLIGLAHGNEINLQDDLTYVKNNLELNECITSALKNRPEVAINNAAIAIAEDDVKIADSGNLPTVTLNGYNGWQDTHLPGTKDGYYSYYLTISYNLFDSGITKSKKKEATAALHKAQDNAAQQNDTIYASVNQYYLGMREAEKRIETCGVSVAEAEEALKIAKIRFEAGMGINQDVLDAETALSTARNNYIQALYDYNTNRAGLETAMGVAVKE